MRAEIFLYANHSLDYEARLETLTCQVEGCFNLVMTAVTTEVERAICPQLCRVGDENPSRCYMKCLLAGDDKKIVVPNPVNRWGAYTAVGHTHYEANDSGVAEPLPTDAVVPLGGSAPIILEITVRGATYLAKGVVYLFAIWGGVLFYIPGYDVMV